MELKWLVSHVRSNIPVLVLFLHHQNNVGQGSTLSGQSLSISQKVSNDFTFLLWWSTVCSN